MAEVASTENIQSKVIKEKKVRACPRTRRRRRKFSTAVSGTGADAEVTTAESPEGPRWVKVSSSRKPADRWIERSSETRVLIHTRPERTPSTMTPSNHLVPVPLLSTARTSREASSSMGTSSVPGGFWTAYDGTGISRGVRASVQGVEGPVMATASWQTGDMAAHSLGFLVTNDPALPFWHSDPEQAVRGHAAEPGRIDARRVPYVPEGHALWNSMPVHYGEETEPLLDESEVEIAERRRWQEWARHAAEQERQRRMKILENMDREECRERLARRAWALSAMDEEQRRRAGQQFLLSIEGTNWFQGTISSVDLDYEIVCPYSSLGCRHICLRTKLEDHLANGCRYNKEPEDSDSATQVHASEYEVVCPNTILGCDHSCSRSSLNKHLETCRFTGPDRTEEKAERERSLQMVLQQAEEERARRVADDARGEWQSDSLALKTRQFLHRLLEDQMRTALVLLHKEILDFAARCRLVQERRKQALKGIWGQVEGVVRLMWPSSSVLPYGSWASGMMTPDSDLDLVVCLRPRGSASSQSASRGGMLPDAPPAARSWSHEEHSNHASPHTPEIIREEGCRAGERDYRPSELQEQCDSIDRCATSKATAAVRGITPSDAPRVAVELDAEYTKARVPVFKRQGDAQHDARAKEDGPPSRAPSATPSISASGGSNRSRASIHAGDRSWERRRGWGRTDGGSMLSRIQDLADHLRQHAHFIEVVKVVDMARVPIIKAIAVSDSGGKSEERLTVNVDISIDGPTHTGMSTSGFVSYLADHLPNLVPLTMVLKSLLQSNGMNDPFTGGLSSYGLVLMVAFALLRRDHFPPSPSGPCVVDRDLPQQCKSDPSSVTPRSDSEEAQDRDECLDTSLHPADASQVCRFAPEERSEVDAYYFPPSPGHAEGFPPSSLSSPPQSEPHVAPTSRKTAASVGRQRGFWLPSSLAEHCATSAATYTTRNRLDETPTSVEGKNTMPLWDRPRQQHWVGSRTARAILMQDFYAGAPPPRKSAIEKGSPSSHMEHPERLTIFPEQPKTAGECSLPAVLHGVPPPPPPPLPQPAENDVLCPLLAPRSPYITSGGDPVLGELLLDFLHLFGEDFDMAREGFSVRGGGFRFDCHDNPPHPQAGDPIVIEDPLNCMNNVGRSCFAIGQVQRTFFEALTTLKATMVRVNQDGKEVLVSGSNTPKTNTGILRHICNSPGSSGTHESNTY